MRRCVFLAIVLASVSLSLGCAGERAAEPPPAARCAMGPDTRWQLTLGAESSSPACPFAPAERRLAALTREVVLEQRGERVRDTLDDARIGIVESERADGPTCRVELVVRDDGGGRAARMRYVLAETGGQVTGELRYEDAQVPSSCEDRFVLTGSRGAI